MGVKLHRQVEQTLQAIENLTHAIASLKAEKVSAHVLRPYEENLIAARAKLARLQQRRR